MFDDGVVVHRLATRSRRRRSLRVGPNFEILSFWKAGERMAFKHGLTDELLERV